MEGRLINAVANNPELYDTSCFVYRDRNIKDRAWRKICEEIGQPEQTDSAAEPSPVASPGSPVPGPSTPAAAPTVMPREEDSSEADEGLVLGRSIGGGAGHPGVPEEATPVSNGAFPPQPCSCSGEQLAPQQRGKFQSSWNPSVMDRQSPGEGTAMKSSTRQSQMAVATLGG
ncbi:golgi phosphoprotein 3 [Sarotherodon galilaeus]